MPTFGHDCAGQGESETSGSVWWNVDARKDLIPSGLKVLDFVLQFLPGLGKMAEIRFTNYRCRKNW